VAVLPVPRRAVLGSVSWSAPARLAFRLPLVDLGKLGGLWPRQLRKIREGGLTERPSLPRGRTHRPALDPARAGPTRPSIPRWPGV